MKRAICTIALLTVILTLPSTAQVIFFNYDTANFSATGYWVSADSKEKSAYASETQIDCFRNNICVEATAEFYMGHPHVSLEYLDIIKWDRDGIIATSSSGICMTVTMQVSFAEKRLSSTHSAKRLDDKTKEACKSFQADKTQEDIFVLRGSERWTKEHSFIPSKPE